MAISQNLDSYERLDLVKFLILKKASPEVADGAGSTPLIEASKTGFVPFLQYLVPALPSYSTYPSFRLGLPRRLQILWARPR